jgi:DNA-binding MarR family transcriptional regulator
MTENEQLIARGVELQVRVNRIVRGLEADDPWLALELTMPQLKVLFLLNVQGASKVGFLARALRVTLPTMTGILDRLVEQDLIRRDEDPGDRRLVMSRLTPRGQELVDQLHAAGRSRLVRVFAAMKPEDLEGHVASLEQVLAAAQTVAQSEETSSPSGARR